jgi:hypothetical protein
VHAGEDRNLLLEPEAAWAQVTLLIPVLESSPVAGGSKVPEWRGSVAEFPVHDEPGMHADRGWRSIRIAAGARSPLYDQRRAAVLAVPAELGQLRRDGRLVTLTAGQLEFLPTGIIKGFGPGGILIVHAEMHGPSSAGLRLGEDRLPVKWLASVIKELARPPAGKLPGASQLVSGWGLSLDPEPEILVAVNLAVAEETLQVLRHDPAAAITWDSLTCWTWSLARGTVPSPRMLRAPASPATPGRTVVLPRRLAIVDRAGMAIMATDPVGSNPDITRILANFIPVFQSVYTDTLVLGFLQVLVTAEVGARLDALDDPVDQPRELHSIETRMRLLHNRFWRGRISEWPWLNQILRSFQEENDLPTLIGQLNDSVHDFGDQIERNYQHGLNLILLLLAGLGFVGVVAGVFSAIAAFMTVLGTGHWGAVVGIVATSAGVLALIGGTALFLRHGAGRALSPYMRRRGR